MNTFTTEVSRVDPIGAESWELKAKREVIKGTRRHGYKLAVAMLYSKASSSTLLWSCPSTIEVRFRFPVGGNVK